MDRREAMSLSGSASYFMQRGMPGSANVLQGASGIHSISDPTLQFQSNVGGGSFGSTLPVEPSSAIPPHGVNMGAPSVVPSGEHVRKKRGRPRKYGPEGAMPLALSPSSSTPAAKLTPIQKRGRGRPPGSGQKQQLFGQGLSGLAGMGFTPHVITIVEGEDITKKIMSFAQQGPRAICILSANGAISTVTLRQPSTSGGTVKYEGRFEILRLSGSYLPTDKGGPSGRSGGLSVLLASPDGRVVGGGVGGVLIAASPIQVIVGSFLCSSSKTKNKTVENKTVESLESAEDSDRQTVDNPVSPSSIQPSRNLAPTPSMSVWFGSQNAHADIDLMRE